MKRKFMALINIVLLVAIVVALVGFFADKPTTGVFMPSGAAPEGGAGTLATAGVVLSEIMISNNSAVVDEDGDYPDWVELYNGTDTAISLGGYSLSDREDNAAKFPLPDVQVEAHGYLTIYLSGKNRSVIGQPLHAGFKLKAGETLYLFSGSAVMDQVAAPQTPTNYVYARTETGWEQSEYYSPGQPNTQQGHEAYRALYDQTATSTLKINEVQSSNLTTLTDEKGLYPDWIEIVNLGQQEVDLTGYGLSDNDSKPSRWKFTLGSIPAGGRLLVFASGEDRHDTEIPHTNFSISAGGEPISLYSPQGYLLDRVELPEMQDDVAFARTPDGTGEWAVTQQPTPGQANTEENQLALARQFFQTHNQGLYLSEVMTNNAGSLSVDGVTPDWVELYNSTGAPIDLEGYRLTNNAGRTAKYVFPAYTMQAGERLVVYLTGENKADPANGKFYASFKGSAQGERLYLYSPQGQILDRLTVPALSADISYGRDDAQGLFYYAESTPGAVNAPTGYQGVSQTPQFLTASGQQSAGASVELTVPEGAQVYYTTDCTEPNENDTLYTGPISVSDTTVLRARAFRPGYLPSDTNTATYIYGQPHSARIVSLVAEPDHLFSDSKGMYANGPGYQSEFPHGAPGRGANFWMDWEYPVHVEVWEPDGAQLVSQGGTFKLNGQYSRALDQKSFSVYARKSEGGLSRFEAPLFSGRDYTSYKSFVMRCTGQDYNRSRMRDAMMTSLMAGQGVMYQETEVAVLYLNGKYWGHYNMRERVNKYSVAQFEGVTDEAVIDKIDILKGNGNSAARTLNGSNKEYMELIDYVESHDLRNEENLKYVTDRVDLQNYLDYQIAEIFWANSDNGNIKYYKVPGGKWKWILYDLDWGINTGETNGYKRNGFDHVLDPRGTGVNDAFNNVLIRKLLENPTVKQLFLERCVYYVRDVYTKDNIYAAIEKLRSQMEPEMARHYERWPDHGSTSSWERHIGYLKTFADHRTSYMIDDIKEYFSLSDSQVDQYFGAQQ